ncbi:MAG: serine/threonine-protein kinase [Nocardioides sp.]|uniref:serine/threonine-protein kinase n=1 Tax=Nocardioides sp. TaxID=35761 RepID=UPI003F0915C2
MTASLPYQSAPPPGLAVDGYELRARLGEGGMGVVHLAQRPGERPVALKVLRPNVVGDDEARRRLAREVDSLSRVRSRRVAEIVDADPWGAIPYVATRYVPGLTLHDHARDEGPIVGDDLLWFADCLAEALEAVHAVGVLHRDIKPSNVILEGRTPILIDFGLARIADDAKVTQTGFLLGTPGYLAPEILFGEEATEVSDVHSWAATVAFAAQARAPFGRGPSMAVMDRVRRGEHDIDDVEDGIRELLDEALAPDPDDRPDLAEVRDWLAELTAPPKRRRWGRERAVEAYPAVTMPYTAAPDPELAADLLDDDLLDEPWDGAGVVEPAPRTPGHLPPTRIDRSPYAPGPVDGLEPSEEDQDAWSSWTQVEAPPRAGLAERMRRGVLLVGSAAVATAAAAAAPWLFIVTLSLLVWLLRTGSLATSAVERRRSTRGRRWWDGTAGLLSTPWHLLAAVPATGLLLLWSLGMGSAAALLAYALSLGATTALALVGLTVVLSAWWGPGSGRFRGPVRRVVDGAASRGVPWFLVALVVAAAASGLAGYAQQSGPNWAPASDAPFAGTSTPSWF